MTMIDAQGTETKVQVILGVDTHSTSTWRWLWTI